jgi:hypothetical protein
VEQARVTLLFAAQFSVCTTWTPTAEIGRVRRCRRKLVPALLAVEEPFLGGRLGCFVWFFLILRTPTSTLSHALSRSSLAADFPQQEFHPFSPHDFLMRTTWTPLALGHVAHCRRELVRALLAVEEPCLFGRLGRFVWLFLILRAPAPFRTLVARR